MDIDRKTAAALGFPKTTYMAVERERRWIARECATSVCIGVYGVAQSPAFGLVMVRHSCHSAIRDLSRAGELVIQRTKIT